MFRFILCVLVFLGAHSSHALCVKSSIANLRKGPSTRYKKLWTVYRYMPFRKLRKKGSWYRVKGFEGNRYWIHKSLITRNYRCAVVKVPRLNLRSGPGTNYRRLLTVDRYYTFRVLRFKKKWVKLVDEFGDKFWAFRKMLWVY